MNTLVYEIAKKIAEAKGRAFLVGGSVRDELLNKDIVDYDIEVFNLKEEELEQTLSDFGTILKIGKSFAIYSLAHHNIDIALPRKEKKIGSSHRDFLIEADPYLSYKEASMRRDFTMNALMKDILSGEILDYHGGIQDIENKIIRHINDKRFIEDPLRVFRACRFKASLDFEIAKETLKLCSEIDIQSLSRERVKEELDKALVSDNAYDFFGSLKLMNQNEHFFKGLIIDERLKEHLDRAKDYKDKVYNYLYFSYALICLDIEDIDGFIKTLTNERQLINYIIRQVSILKYFADLKDIKELILMIEEFNHSEDSLSLLKVVYPDRSELIEETQIKYKSFKDKRKLRGDDLLRMGYETKKLKELIKESNYLLIDNEYDEVKKMMEERCIRQKM